MSENLKNDVLKAVEDSRRLKEDKKNHGHIQYRSCCKDCIRKRVLKNSQRRKRKHENFLYNCNRCPKD